LKFAARRRGVALGLALLSLLAACSGGDDGGEAKPTTTAPPATGSPTTPPVFTVPGNPRTTTTMATEIGPGEASISGTAATADGPVPDGVVHVERLIDDRVASIDVSISNGQWQLPQIRGGRYRVRAWRSPDMAQLQPDVFFLGSTETKQIPLVLTRFGDTSVIGTTDPAPMQVGETAALTTQVVSGSVDTEGVVHANPHPNVAVQLVTSGGISLDGSDRQTTDGEGNTSWRVRCTQAAPPSLSVAIGSERYPVALAACVAP
jgi:hypothetical protein